ncbi:MFS general substrate transporter [Dothidotthia symphoricarpi CBS 119687]|uniref:MFS general substrate transporter n=1 Tax=Dothidotthia symphoricarpi CBS 119687 TaxID=1392245 RepID=A0A6A6ABP3_9PLEO|nr:MFS general substrate transporter [Dothidotthia symphoricarpi CBS 119687]KAF2128633.1 MFS general substrate transporter [Dothidotthia symphoricarpi CBS 119687]
MSALIRDAPLGQILRYLTNNRILQYPEERPDFQLPDAYTRHIRPSQRHQDDHVATPVTKREAPPHEEPIYPDPETVLEKDRISSDDDERLSLEKPQTIRSTHTTRTQISRVGTRTALQKSVSQADLEHQISLASMDRGPSRPIDPDVLDDGTTLVDWYATDDPDNPQNWSSGKKAIVLLQILVYTTGVYMGSAIYTPSIPGVMQHFGVEIGAASLGLSMYVAAYGIGPLLFSPLSEIPGIGRSPPYTISYAIFVILLVPTALVDNFAGLIVLRFLQGFFGSPCLATGGATLQDIYSLLELPYVLSLWAFAATCGPALGPIISAFSVAAKTWRWSLWEMLWLNGPIFLILFAFLPETSSSTILLRRAQRLRKLTQTPTLQSASELAQASLTTRAIATEALWRPFQLMLLDPSIAFTALYIGIIYAIFYSFFEAFPLVYGDIYAFTPAQTALTFLSVTVGVAIALAAYWYYIHSTVTPRIISHGLGPPEHRLIPALYTSLLVPAGLFLFAWSATPNIHWIVSCIGIALATIGIFIIFQTIFLYLAFSYPQFAASLFAGNDFARSAMAAGAVHFSTPLFGGLGVGRGVSLLAGLTVGCAGGVYVLFFYGERLRGRSRFAAR